MYRGSRIVNGINMGGQSELKKKEEIGKVKGRGNLC